MARPRIYDEERVESTMRLRRSNHDRLQSYVARPEVNLSANAVLELALEQFLARQEAPVRSTRGLPTWATDGDALQATRGPAPTG